MTALRLTLVLVALMLTLLMMTALSSCRLLGLDDDVPCAAPEHCASGVCGADGLCALAGEGEGEEGEGEGEVVPEDPSLIAGWAFEALVDGVVLDVGPDGHDLSVEGDGALLTTGARGRGLLMDTVVDESRQGRRASAASLDASALGADSFTITLCGDVLENLRDFDTLLYLGGGDGTDVGVAFEAGLQGWNFGISDGEGTYVVVDVGGEELAGTGLHCFAFVVDREANVARGYRDGAFINEEDIEEVGPFGIGRALELGAGQGGSQPFYGVLDEVRLFARVFDDDEIAALHTARGPACPLRGQGDGDCEVPDVACLGASFGDTFGPGNTQDQVCLREAETATEQVWRFDPEGEGTLEIALVTDVGNGLGFYVRSQCAEPSTMLLCTERSDDSVQRFRVAVDGEPVFIIVDGAVFPQEYTLSLELLPEVCGDGVRSAAEECDDGNTLADDLCSADCALEADIILEAEPNDDGADPGEVDFDAALAEGPITKDALFAGDITPRGDEDAYEISNEGSAAITVRAEGYTLGIADCGGEEDLKIILRDETGDEISENNEGDDEGIALCPRLEITLEPGESVFVSMEHVVDFQEAGSYVLVLDFP